MCPSATAFRAEVGTAVSQAALALMTAAGLAAGLPPAYRAARSDPADALKYE